jgi:hypothetical protein
MSLHLDIREFYVLEYNIILSTKLHSIRSQNTVSFKVTFVKISDTSLILLLRMYTYVIMLVGSHDLATFKIEDNVLMQSWHLHKTTRHRPRDSMSVHTKQVRRRSYPY